MGRYIGVVFLGVVAMIGGLYANDTLSYQEKMALNEILVALEPYGNGNMTAEEISPYLEELEEAQNSHPHLTKYLLVIREYLEVPSLLCELESTESLEGYVYSGILIRDHNPFGMGPNGMLLDHGDVWITHLTDLSGGFHIAGVSATYGMMTQEVTTSILAHQHADEYYYSASQEEHKTIVDNLERNDDLYYQNSWYCKNTQPRCKAAGGNYDVEGRRISIKRDIGGYRFVYTGNALDGSLPDDAIVLDATYKFVGHVFTTQDFQHLAYAADTGNGWIVGHDYESYGPYTSVNLLGISPDGKSVVYYAARGDKIYFYMNGQEMEYYGPVTAYGSILSIDKDYSFDQNKLAYRHYGAYIVDGELEYVDPDFQTYTFIDPQGGKRVIKLAKRVVSPFADYHYTMFKRDAYNLHKRNGLLHMMIASENDRSLGYTPLLSTDYSHAMLLTCKRGQNCSMRINNRSIDTSAYGNLLDAVIQEDIDMLFYNEKSHSLDKYHCEIQ